MAQLIDIKPSPRRNLEIGFGPEGALEATEATVEAARLMLRVTRPWLPGSRREGRLVALRIPKSGARRHGLCYFRDCFRFHDPILGESVMPHKHKDPRFCF